jgi:glycine hydroxymethyltransferase
MGAEEMREIAAVISVVLKNTKPETIASGENAGKPGKAKYIIDKGAANEARARVKALLDKYPVYPQLDLDFLKKHFC